MTQTGKHPNLWLQVNSLSIDSEKNHYDAILSQKNKYGLRIIQTPHTTISSMSIYLIDGKTSREYFLGSNKNNGGVIFSPDETTWQLAESKYN